MPFPWRSFHDWLSEEEKLGELLRIKTPIKCGDPNSIVDVVPAGVREENMRVLNCPGANGKQMETELRALGRYLHTLPNSPIGFIEKPVSNRPDVPIIINPWPTRERALRMGGCKNKEELCKKYRELKTKLIKPVVVSRKNALVKEVVITEQDIDIYKDLPRIWVEFENVPWSPCGGGQGIVFDPETKTHDIAEWRCGFFEWENGDPDRPLPEDRRKRHMYVGIPYTGPVASDSGRFYARYRRQNKPMPAAYAMCNDPGIFGTAVARLSLVWPEDRIDEYAAAGGFRGAPLEVVESETIPGLMVPANAEWVIEGEFLPEDYQIPMYGEAIYSGHMIGGTLYPVFKIKCITHRKDPMWCTTWSSNGLNHRGVHTGAADLVFEVEAINYLRQCGYNVKDVVSYDCEVIVVQSNVDGIEKVPHYGKALLSALYGCPHGYLGSTNKYYIAVGPDINPYDLRDVIWAIGTRSQPASDSIMIEKGLCAWGDPSGMVGPMGMKAYGEQMLIDALIKVPERSTEWMPRSEPVSWEKKEIERMKEKMGL